ncbi:MAG TPA: transketolase C-terminal domain-containing protein [Chloroflexota bacterium]|nr:transketolase C-terminal domain-containing protein [Chloroflexota bacterium]
MREQPVCDHRAHAAADGHPGCGDARRGLFCFGVAVGASLNNVRPIGTAIVRRTGTAITLVSYGLMLHYALEAAENVAEQGIDVEVIDLRTLRPLDRETILTSVRKTGKALIVHEANKTGGIGAEVAAIIAEEAFDALDGPVTRLCGPDVPAMGYAPPLEHAYLLDPEAIGRAGAVGGVLRRCHIPF